MRNSIQTTVYITTMSGYKINGHHVAIGAVSVPLVTYFTISGSTLGDLHNVITRGTIDAGDHSFCHYTYIRSPFAVQIVSVGVGHT